MANNSAIKYQLADKYDCPNSALEWMLHFNHNNTDYLLLNDWSECGLVLLKINESFRKLNMSYLNERSFQFSDRPALNKNRHFTNYFKNCTGMCKVDNSFFFLINERKSHCYMIKFTIGTTGEGNVIFEEETRQLVWNKKDSKSFNFPARDFTFLKSFSDKIAFIERYERLFYLYDTSCRLINKFKIDLKPFGLEKPLLRSFEVIQSNQEGKYLLYFTDYNKLVHQFDLEKDQTSYKTTYSKSFGVFECPFYIAKVENSLWIADWQKHCIFEYDANNKRLLDTKMFIGQYHHNISSFVVLNDCLYLTRLLPRQGVEPHKHYDKHGVIYKYKADSKIEDNKLDFKLKQLDLNN